MEVQILFSMLPLLVLYTTQVQVGNSQFVPVCELDKTGSPCICRSNAGMIDLTNAASTNGRPAFQSTLSNGDVVTYNPCYSYTQGQCKNVSACMITRNGTYIPLGTQNTAYFADNAIQATLYLEYSAKAQDNKLRQTHVLLTCQPEASPGIFTTIGETKPGSNIWVFNLQSMYACGSWYPPPVLNLEKNDKAADERPHAKVHHDIVDDVIFLHPANTDHDEQPVKHHSFVGVFKRFYNKVERCSYHKMMILLLMIGLIGLVAMTISHIHRQRMQSKPGNGYKMMINVFDKTIPSKA